MSYFPTLRRLGFIVPAFSVNDANTDVATITGLPALYTVVSCLAFGASGALTLATLSVRTAAGGGGSAVVNAAALAGLSGTTLLSLTLGLTTTLLTGGALYVRNVAAEGGAATAKLYLEVIDLT